ncbi:MULTISPECIES: amino acid ABC transporter substrate-binding protein [unclassified Pusillimonas]|uniref:amino acid ABC transporter substrate-binding protein n=1 Tax=unclassified Pusillimonas TaxID=2640016 RepID=UPI000B9D06E1|nr:MULTISPECIES: amino acid ABC transporter substrate-binding protein [unclassified Pusillimonas]OXR49168.1 hypothetical protein PuT2_09060 [Pusillimonas sp. T2]ROT46047.1 hypothetical protein CHR62_03445 [Pusillimonas sp. NJUB218]
MKTMKNLARLALATLTLSVTATSFAVEPVRIGFGISKTGELAPTAAGPLAAYELWRDQVNARGGLDVAGTKRPVEFVVYDDQSDGGKEAAIYEKLITDDKVDLLLSPWGSHNHFAIVGVLEKHGFPMVGSTASSQQIRSLKAKNIWFPTSAIPDKHGVEMARMLKEMGVKTAAVTTVQIGFPMENRKELLPALKEAGIKVVLDQQYAPGVKDMTGILADIKRLQPDAVISLSYPPDAILYMRGAREQDIKAPFQFLLVGPTAAFFSNMFGKNLDNIVTMGHWSPEKTDWPGAREFFDAYKAKTGETPDYLDAVLTYVSAQILEQAVAKAGLEKDALRKTISSETFSTINGPIRFNGVQNDVTPTMFLQFQNGDVQIIHPPEMATAKFQPKTQWEK